MSLQQAAIIVAITGMLTSTAAADSAQAFGRLRPPAAGARLDDAQRAESGEPRLGSTQSGAQKRPYNRVMKDVGSTFDTLRKAVEGGDVTAAAANAEKLEGLLRETEDFWTPFKTKDAIDAARSAREASAAVAAAARDKDGQKAKTVAVGLGRSCTTCHNSHREQMPDKSYRIRP